MTWTECPSCGPNGVECYEHGPEDMDLARALAGFFQGKADPDAEQVAWFLGDAAVLRAEAGPGPYTLTLLEQGWHNEHAFVLNNLIVAIGEGGKDGPATPEVVAKLPKGVSARVLAEYIAGQLEESSAPRPVCPVCLAPTRVEHIDVSSVFDQLPGTTIPGRAICTADREHTGTRKLNEP